MGYINLHIQSLSQCCPTWTAWWLPARAVWKARYSGLQLTMSALCSDGNNDAWRRLPLSTLRTADETYA